MPTTQNNQNNNTATNTTTENENLPFHIGSDPEFLLFYGQRGLDVSQILRNFFQGSEYQETNMGYEITNKGDFGWDGASSTGELRPKAAKNIDKHVGYLRTMLETINEKIPFVDITTLSIGSPIGGHIHVDSFKQKDRETGNFSKTDNRIMNKANRVLATFLLPIAASDHRISAMARLKGSYGKLSDIRYENKTHATTAEIRALTAEWLTTPELARATIAYITVVWHEIKNRHDELNKIEHIMRTQDHVDSVHRLLLSDYNIITNAIVRELKKQIKTFELYPKFKKECDLILNPEKVYKIKEKVGWNINKGWKLNKRYGTPNKKTLLDEKKVQEVLGKEDVPQIEKNFAVNYNDDYNVAYFAKAISDRVAVLNWQLNKKYALFGFKKGATGITTMHEDGKFYTLSDNQSLERTLRTTQNMKDRFVSNRPYGAARIDPKTGKTTGHNAETIIIGLPYDIRNTNDVKPMIELIWQIETGRIQRQNYESFPQPTEPPVNKNQPNQDLEDTIIQAGRDVGRGNMSESVESIINEVTREN